MFIQAIEIAAKYTRPLHSMSQNYDSTVIQPGTATLFFVNAEGWALTCVGMLLRVALAILFWKKQEGLRLKTQRPFFGDIRKLIRDSQPVSDILTYH